MTAPNAELAYRILDQIDAHPETWDQRSWARRSKCGTAFCFAGWAVELSGRILVWDSRGRNSAVAEFVLDDRTEGGQQWLADAAREALGIDDSDWLFYGDNTREELGSLVAEIFGPRLAERGPDIYAHIQRRGLFHVEWEITAGPTGEPLAFGSTLTRGGAHVEAVAAAHGRAGEVAR